MTHAQYLAALVELHRRARERADGGDDELRRALDELGLTSVTVPSAMTGRAASVIRNDL
jgi:alkylation response protein AidB-like acyl-CoA dehydrogenase